MKKILLFLTALFSISMYSQTPCSNGTAGGFQCNGMTLQGKLSIAQMGGRSYGSNDPMEAQDSWGWVDPSNNKEYAIVALNDGTAFVNISNPNSPVFLGKMNTRTGTSWWRDVKIFNNYAYVVSDDNGSHGVQIFDLTRLRGLSQSSTNASMRLFVPDGVYTGVGSAHNIFINEDSGYAYILGSNVNSGAPRILNLNSNPTNPPVAGNIPSSYGYCHDAQVVIYDGPDPDYQGKEILIGSFSGADYLKILDVTNKNSITQISQIDYSNKYYTHQGWFTEDKRFFIVGDELDEGNVGFNTRTLVFDLIDLDNPVLHYTYSGATAAIDHNGYVRNNRFYLANYRAGLRVMKVDALYDLDGSGNPNPSMTEVEFFDTHPGSNSAAYHGAWSVYPYFPSGNITISDLDQGLVIVKDPNYDNTPPVAVCQPFTAILNKTTGSVTINAIDIDGGSTDNFGITKRTITGQTTFTCNDVGNSFNVTLTVEDDYGLKSSCSTVVTVAGETTEYVGAGVWTNGTPDIGSNAKISNDFKTTDPINPLNTSFTACTCEVDATKTLTVSAGDHINITKDITVNGTLIVEHQGSVVQEDANALVTNNGTINVNVTTPTLKPRDFMMMGSPMTLEQRTGVFANAYTFRNHVTSNFIPHPQVAIDFPGAENFVDDNFNDFLVYTGTINPGEGYLVRPQPNQNAGNTTYDLTYTLGTLNNGNVTYNVGYNTPGPTAADNKNASPNMLANPYASAISANDFINANAMVDELYFWEHVLPPSSSFPGGNTANFSMEDISMYNLTGGTAATNNPGSIPNEFIATGQGFAIKANAAGTATFSNTMRRTDNNNTLRNPLNTDRLWLKVRNEQYELDNTTLIGFNEQASAGLDPGYDSRRLATIVSLYSHLEDGSQELGIQSREAFDDAIKIPMGFSTLVEETVEYTISITNLEGVFLNSTTVYLVDNLENITTNLNTEDYVFSAGKGTYDARFTLMFESELGNIDNVYQNIKVYPNPTTNIVNIFSPDAVINNIEVFDLRGRRIVEILNQEDNNYQLDLSKLETAVYFVKIYTSSGSITKKVIKK